MGQRIPLVKDTIENAELDLLADWLRTYPRLTKGALTLEFEERWANWLGTKYSVYVNSGSSANLMMLNALQLSGRLKNHKVVVPSLAWATDLAPVIQLGMQPLICDVNLDNLAVELNHLEEIFRKEEPAVLLLVSVLGLPPNMVEIQSLCDRYQVLLLEDNCESLGTQYDGKKLGTFGAMTSFSLYFGHHISTIEGGMICTDDAELNRLLKMIRSHGWDRDLPVAEQQELRTKWQVSEFDALYTFYVPGFNFRGTDLQAFIGLQQLKKLDHIVTAREENYQKIRTLLAPELWRPTIPANHFVSNFCYPVIHPQRKRIVNALLDAQVEVRPLICGSMGTQPMYAEIYGKLELPNASLVDQQGCYVPNNHQLTDEEINTICTTINQAL